MNSIRLRGFKSCFCRSVEISFQQNGFIDLFLDLLRSVGSVEVVYSLPSQVFSSRKFPSKLSLFILWFPFNVAPMFQNESVQHHHHHTTMNNWMFKYEFMKSFPPQNEILIKLCSKLSKFQTQNHKDLNGLVDFPFRFVPHTTSSAHCPTMVRIMY